MLMAIFGCERIKPTPPQATSLDSSLNVPLSSVFLPIRYHVDSLEEVINSKIHGTFIQQWLEVNANHDSLHITLVKKDKIKIRWINNTLHYTLPIHLEGKFIKHVNKQITLRNEVPVSTDIELSMSTALAFAHDWQLNPKTSLKHWRWKKEPVLRVAFININLRKRLDRFLKEQGQLLTSLVDRELVKILDTRDILHKLWIDIQKPILISKQQQAIWLKHTAQALEARLLQDGRYLGLDVRLFTLAKAGIDSVDMPDSNQKLPAYKSLSNANDSIQLYLLTNASFNSINKVLSQVLEGKTISHEQYTTKIKRVKCYGTPNGLAIQLEVKGDADGTIYLRGKPHYDSAHSILSIRDFNYDLDSENTLLQSADWLLHDDAIAFVEQELSFSLSTMLEALPQTIEGAVKKGKSANQLELFLSSLQVKPQALLITKNNIELLLKANGRAVIGLQSDVFAKKEHKKAR